MPRFACHDAAMRHAALLAAVLTLAGPGARPALAQAARIEDRAVFDLTIRGVSAGSFTLAAVQDGAAYAASATLKSGGLAALMKRFSYAAEAKGRIANGRYRPASYSEVAVNGSKTLARQMAFKGGKPVRIATQPERAPRPYDVAPGTMAGSVDPMTAIYLTLRDVSAGAECRVDVVLFDGTEAAGIRLSNPAASNGTVTCAGEYRRIAGYPEKEMRERTRFPFTLTYSPVEGGRMRVTSLDLETTLGRASMVRR